MHVKKKTWRCSSGRYQGDNPNLELPKLTLKLSFAGPFERYPSYRYDLSYGQKTLSLFFVHLLVVALFVFLGSSEQGYAEECETCNSNSKMGTTHMLWKVSKNAMCHIQISTSRRGVYKALPLWWWLMNAMISAGGFCSLLRAFIGVCPNGKRRMSLMRDGQVGSRSCPQDYLTSKLWYFLNPLPWSRSFGEYNSGTHTYHRVCLVCLLPENLLNI